MIFTTNSPAESEALGAALAAKLMPGTVIAYRGDLGAGKTAFTRGLARGLGCTDLVTSPTYTIVNEYCGSHAVFHFDMYRIEDEEDLYAIGFEDYLAREGYIFIEWSENVKGALPSPHVTLSITRTDDACGRRIEIRGLDAIAR